VRGSVEGGDHTISICVHASVRFLEFAPSVLLTLIRDYWSATRGKFYDTCPCPPQRIVDLAGPHRPLPESAGDRDKLAALLGKLEADGETIFDVDLVFAKSDPADAGWYRDAALSPAQVRDGARRADMDDVRAAKAGPVPRGSSVLSN